MSRRLHFGCGKRLLNGWENYDYDINLTKELPWPNGTFSVALGQHVIEHLELVDEVIPLFKELHRVISKNGILWLSCPDINKICKAYVDGTLQNLYDKKISRWPKFTLKGAPLSHLVNDFFTQRGQHKNLFDIELLTWSLNQSGWYNITVCNESDLLLFDNHIIKRHDDECSLYVKIIK